MSDCGVDGTGCKRLFVQREINKCYMQLLIWAALMAIAAAMVLYLLWNLYGVVQMYRQLRREVVSED